ncbi:MAG: hypothetical protein KBD23_06435 [Gammaproteobacteria bacterium]|nr:hypothetical protein [Gammaproteobacteria bacterium]MBP9729749.1 hypothetical protein [Gammaproteobacteria bacterium]
MKKILTVLTALMAVGCSLATTAAMETDTTHTTTTEITNTTTVETPKVPPQYTIAISTPADQDTFTTTADSLNVSVMIIPELESDDTVTLYVDGSASGEPVHGTNLSAPALARGSHTLQAKINQKNGAGAESQSITVYQQGHGVTSPIPSSAPRAPAAPRAPMAPAAPH